MPYGFRKAIIRIEMRFNKCTRKQCQLFKNVKEKNYDEIQQRQSQQRGKEKYTPA